MQELLPRVESGAETESNAAVAETQKREEEHKHNNLFSATSHHCENYLYYS